jgi:hypothetical protein
MGAHMKHEHECAKWSDGSRQWSYCVVCEGRIHMAGCTSRRSALKDCCPARHKMLHDSGKKRAIADHSFLMWTAEHTTGVHESELKR